MTANDVVILLMRVNSVLPGEFFLPSDFATRKELLDLEFAREPSEAELAVYLQITGQTPAPVVEATPITIQEQADLGEKVPESLPIVDEPVVEEKPLTKAQIKAAEAAAKVQADEEAKAAADAQLAADKAAKVEADADAAAEIVVEQEAVVEAPAAATDETDDLLKE